MPRELLVNYVARTVAATREKTRSCFMIFLGFKTTRTATEKEHLGGICSCYLGGLNQTIAARAIRRVRAFDRRDQVRRAQRQAGGTI